MTRQTMRVLDRISSVVPTVRGRLSALVLDGARAGARDPRLRRMAVPQAGPRCTDRCVDAVVRLMQRELDDRITRAAHRLEVLAADPDVISLSPAATRKLVDALRDDRLYNNVLIADGATGDVRASAVPLDRPGERARELLAFQRARHTLDFATGAFLPEPATGEPGLNLAAPVVNDVGTVDVRRAGRVSTSIGCPDSSNAPAFRPSTVLTVLDDRGVVQYRSVDLDKYVGKPAGSVRRRRSAAPPASAIDADGPRRRRALVRGRAAGVPRPADGQPRHPRDSARLPIAPP